MYVGTYSAGVLTLPHYLHTPACVRYSVNIHVLSMCECTLRLANGFGCLIYTRDCTWLETQWRNQSAVDIFLIIDSGPLKCWKEQFWYSLQSFGWNVHDSCYLSCLWGIKKIVFLTNFTLVVPFFMDTQEIRSHLTLRKRCCYNHLLNFFLFMIFIS